MMIFLYDRLTWNALPFGKKELAKSCYIVREINVSLTSSFISFQWSNVVWGVVVFSIITAFNYWRLFYSFIAPFCILEIIVFIPLDKLSLLFWDVSLVVYLYHCEAVHTVTSLLYGRLSFEFSLKDYCSSANLFMKITNHQCLFLGQSIWKRAPLSFTTVSEMKPIIFSWGN